MDTPGKDKNQEAFLKHMDDLKAQMDKFKDFLEKEMKEPTFKAEGVIVASAMSFATQPMSMLYAKILLDHAREVKDQLFSMVTEN